MKKVISLFLFAVLSFGFAMAASQEKAVANLSKRILKDRSAEFEFKLLANNAASDYFEIETLNKKIVISANSGISLASGLNYYLKNYCHNSVSWLGNNINLPAQLPVVSPKVTVKTDYVLRPYMNYCTLGYSTPYWNWERWERELDWMALNGINMPLLINGQEMVWHNVLKQFNFTEAEIAAFIPGPSHAPWWMMQNLEGAAGPLSMTYIKERAALQKKIVKRANELGMTPIFQGFFGMVPMELAKKYPNEKIYNTGKWGGGYQRPGQLNPDSKLFQDMAQAWYKEQKKLYGTTKYYGGDPFHEGSAPKDVDLVKTGVIIQSCMQKNNPDASWVLQCWQDKPYDDMLRATKADNIVILELSGEGYKFWQKRNISKFKWVYCIINNYGGKLGMYGRFDKVNADLNYYVSHAQERNLKGLGITPEGIENNVVAYDMIYDRVWSNSESTPADFVKKYSYYRYGVQDAKIDSAWSILLRTAYNCPRNQEGTFESILCARPGMNVKNVSTWSAAYELYYKQEDFVNALGLFISKSNNLKSVETYKYDLVDITRQCIANKARTVYADIIRDYHTQDKRSLNKNAKLFLELIDDQDELMGSINEYLLGKWIKDARSWGFSKNEKDLMEYNARLLLTLWKDKDNTVLHEYAHREWNGLLGSLYKDRWKQFFTYLSQKLDNPNTAEVNFFEIEKQWIAQNNSNYRTSPSNNAIELCNKFYAKYFRK